MEARVAATEAVPYADNERSAMLKVGVLASHEGTTLQCILDGCAAGRIKGKVVVVISNNGNSGALARAKAAGIPAHHLSSITHPTPETLDAAKARRFLQVRLISSFLPVI